jgi:hypothetical protein
MWSPDGLGQPSFRRRKPVVHGRERGHEMFLYLPTDQHQPLLGAVGAKLGLRQVGPEPDEPILDFGPDTTKALVRFGSSARDSLVLDPRIGIHPVGALLCLRTTR